MFNISPISAFNDNYIWMIEIAERRAIVVDPGDCQPVITALEAQGLELQAILLTHHHWDHSGGIDGLRQWAARQTVYPQVYGPASSPHADIPCRADERFGIAGLEFPVWVLEVPGHTLDHVAFVIDDALFCGDTLFSGGCGRLFEGSAADLYRSLSQLATLKDSTRVYCAHEYTLANLRFARTVEPTNVVLADYEQQILAIRKKGLPSLPSTLAVEKAINPFLRLSSDTVRSAVESWSGQTVTDAVTCLSLLRRWKDNF